MPRVIRVDPVLPDAAAVGEAVSVLRAGGLVGLPTETVYGLGARALDEAAVARVFRAKGRPAHHPLIAHVDDEDRARELAARWPAHASLLAHGFWPGPLTIIVDRAAHVPAAVAGGGGSIAVRVPSHPVARAVIAALGEPVAAPSANRYRSISPTTAGHVVSQLGEAVDLVLDAGPCDAGIESTVVDVRGAVARILRPGVIGVASLRALLPDLVAGIERAHHDEARPSPGMSVRHYAPRARVTLAATCAEATVLADRLVSVGARAGLVIRQERAAIAAAAGLLTRQLPGDPAEYAKVLYGTLHELDDAGVDAIIVQDVPADEAWWAVADRLRRASEAGDGVIS